MCLHDALPMPYLHVLLTHPRSCLVCFCSNPYISHFNSQDFFKYYNTSHVNSLCVISAALWTEIVHIYTNCCMVQGVVVFTGVWMKAGTVELMCLEHVCTADVPYTPSAPLRSVVNILLTIIHSKHN